MYPSLGGRFLATGPLGKSQGNEFLTRKLVAEQAWREAGGSQGLDKERPIT